MNELKNLVALPGVLESPVDVRDYTIAASEYLPDKFACSPLPPVKSQGSKPTCVAHAASSLVESHSQRQHGEYVEFSTDFIYGTRDVGQYVGDGMYIRNALANLKNYGDCYHVDCPTNSDIQEAMAIVNDRLDELRALAYPHRISSYYRCNTPEQIKTALINHGPVLISMNTYNGATIKNDTYTCDTSKDYGRHCVLLYGWDERGWLIQNSWGKYYAGDGRFVLPFDFKINEAWGVTDDIADPIVIKKRKTPIRNFFYKLYNALANFFINLFKKN